MADIQQLHLHLNQITLTKIKLSLSYLTAVAVVGILSGCQNPPAKISEPPQIRDTADISENIDRLIGKTVSVRNDIEKLVGEADANKRHRALILDQDQVFGGETVLVLNSSNKPFDLFLQEDVEILVTGRVEQFDAEDFEQKYGLSLEQNLLTQYQDKPIIVASRVILSPDPEEITNNPEAYYNQTIAVEGEIDDIEDIITPQLFELDEEQAIGGKDLLVIALEPLPSVEEDQNVIIIGTVHQFTPQFQQDHQLDWSSEVKKIVESEYLNQPVLVAETLEVLNQED